MAMWKMKIQEENIFREFTINFEKGASKLNYKIPYKTPPAWIFD